MRHLLCSQIALAALLLAAQADAKTQRDAKAVAAFKRTEHCPSTGRPRGPCPGYVVDHIIALACAGPDHPRNMQWQTIAEAKAKDKWERRDCHTPRL